MGFGAIGGLIRGAEDDVTRQESRLEVDDPGEFESGLRQQQQDLFDQLSALTTSSGLGASDVQASVGAQRGLADLLRQFQETSGLPSQGDITRSQDLTSALFAPQREALRQSFEQQGIQASRHAAFLGREANDPILANRLAQDQTRQQSFLSAQQGASAQELAFQLPGQRLGFAAQRADILGGLANQAFSQRSALLATGNQLSQQERAARFALGTQTGSTTREGSFGQALLGFSAGLAQDVQTAATVISAGQAGGFLTSGGGGGGGAAGGGQAAGKAASAGQAGRQIFPSQVGGIFGRASSLGFGPNIGLGSSGASAGPLGAPRSVFAPQQISQFSFTGQPLASPIISLGRSISLGGGRR